MPDLLCEGGRVSLFVRQKEISLKEPFVQAASRFAQDEGTVVLASGGPLDSARYNMLAALPWLRFSGHHESMVVSVGEKTERFSGDPLDTLRAILKKFSLEDGLWGPVSSGLFGYLSYDLKDAVETLPRTTLDRNGLPEIWFSAPGALLVEDRKEGGVTLFSTGRSEEEARAFESLFFKRMKDPLPTPGSYGGDGTGFSSNFDRPGYMDAIERIKAYIRSGDIYQVNMSQRFEGAFSGDSYALFLDLFKDNPAPFFAFVQAGDHQVVSTSPERFIKLEGDAVETRPIKGTRPRGRDKEEDLSLKKELEASFKDDAELSMIVDLMRNDIGRVCRAQSVCVREHKRVEAYKNVFHLVSLVEGRLDEGADAVDLVRATFPGGSITGCPKIRSMEIIDELETDCRHIYTGSIGYFSFHGTMDLSIAIRTATLAGGRAFFSVGGGVVYDSDPEDEYEETLHKSATLMRALAGKTFEKKRPDMVWLDGRLVPKAEAKIPLTEKGAQYGAGLFETVRVDDGRPRHLEAHVERLSRGWEAVFGGELPRLSWERLACEVIKANGAGKGTFALKIMAFEGNGDKKGGFSGHLALCIRSYTHRLKEGEEGLRLVTDREHVRGPLGRFKSLNYLDCTKAMERAGQMGAHDALLFAADGGVSELSTANLVLLKDGEAICPDAPSALGGVMQQKVCALLAEWGYSVKHGRIDFTSLFGADGVLATNALMGAVPVEEIDGEKIVVASGVCGDVNRALKIRR